MSALGGWGKRFQVKFFYLTQLAYWLHALPELYFQKVRKVSDASRSASAHACLFCHRRGVLFFRRNFPVSCSTSLCICCTLLQPIY